MKIPFRFFSDEWNNNNSAKRGEAAEQLLQKHGDCGKKTTFRKNEA
jgi:hypothetical protein